MPGEAHGGLGTRDDDIMTDQVSFFLDPYLDRQNEPVQTGGVPTYFHLFSAAGCISICCSAGTCSLCRGSCYPILTQSNPAHKVPNCFQVLLRVDIIRLKSMTVGTPCFRHVQRLSPVGQLFCILPSVCHHVSPCYKTRHHLPFEFSSLEFRSMACTSRFFAENVRSQFECAVTLSRVYCEHPTSV